MHHCPCDGYYAMGSTLSYVLNYLILFYFNDLKEGYNFLKVAQIGQRLHRPFFVRLYIFGMQCDGLTYCDG